MNCKQCGAPVFPGDCQCGYCLSATGEMRGMLEVTFMDDTERKFVTSAGGIVGAVVGAYFGFPQLGMMIGSKA